MENLVQVGLEDVKAFVRYAEVMKQDCLDATRQKSVEFQQNNEEREEPCPHSQ